MVVAKSPMVTPMASAPGLCLQLRHHVGREVDPVYRHAARRERERDAPGADAELQRGAVAGELGQEVDRRTDDSRIELFRRVGVVALGDRPAK